MPHSHETAPRCRLRARRARRALVAAWVAGAALLACGSHDSAAAEESAGDRAPAATRRPPNVVLIVLDDLGLSDLGAYGNARIRTPNLDRVAADGIRFTHYYASSPVCSPTRAALLTGVEPARFGFRKILTAHSRRGLPSSVPTIADLLRVAGYRTLHVGKWHLGTRRPEFLPPARGFDHSVRRVSLEEVEKGLYTRYELLYDERRSVRGAGTKHLTEALTDAALAVLREVPAQAPFFLNLWYLAPHVPLDVPADYDNSATGYDLESPSGRYAALVSNVDTQIGRLLAYLDEHDLARNTLLIVTSDNGAAVRRGPARGPEALRGAKKTLFDGGLRVPLIVRWPERVAADRIDASVLTSLDVLPTLAEIVAAPPGASAAVAGQSFLDVLTGRSSNRPAARPIVFEAKRANRFFDEPEGRYVAWAVRDGGGEGTSSAAGGMPGPGTNGIPRSWKLVFGHSPVSERPLLLFDLASDPRETHNLAGAYPETVERLRTHYENWRRRVGVVEAPATPFGTGVRRDGRDWLFAGSGGAALAPSTLLDFHDGDFTFAIEVELASPEAAGRPAGAIAAREGSWSLSAGGTGVVLELADESGSSLALQAPPLSRGRHHLAFTVFAWKSGPSTIRLYIDGEVAAEALRGLGPIHSSDEAITLGNTADGRQPLRARLSDPWISTLCLEPAQVRALAERAREGNREP